jgi:hypothetical protein
MAFMVNSGKMGEMGDVVSKKHAYTQNLPLTK